MTIFSVLMGLSAATFLVVRGMPAASHQYATLCRLLDVTDASSESSASLSDSRGPLLKRNTIQIAHFHLPADDDLLHNITAAFSDAVALLSSVVETTAWDSPMFDLYFPPEARNDVATTFQRMHGGSPNGAAVSSQVTFDNNDEPAQSDPDRRDCPGLEVTDIKYGPSSVRALRKDQGNDAVRNADSYMWFALVWGVEGKRF
ncbi:MAG: hypothetical protein Q9207_000063 [Kuettlingeria erythrocarpa]